MMYMYFDSALCRANHFHLQLMTMFKRVYITDPLNGVLKQHLMNICLSKSFSVKFLKELFGIFS